MPHAPSSSLRLPQLDDLLQAVADTVQTALPLMTFDERRQLLVILRVRVEVVDQTTIRVNGLLSEAFLVLSPR